VYALPPRFETPAAHAGAGRRGANPGEVRGRELAAIFLGGFLGTLARAGVAEAVPHRAGEWPWATLGVNLGGAFALGCLAAWLAQASPAPLARSFLGPGLLAALTTFSAVQLELLHMLDAARHGAAAGYAAASAAGGLLVVALAVGLVRRLGGGR
jgi:fluoride exporter